MNLNRREFLAGSASLLLGNSLRPLFAQAQEKKIITITSIVSDIRQSVFERINYHRNLHGLNPVTLDPLAQKAGDYHCMDLLNLHSNDAHGHWGSNGLLAHHRYSSVGGKDTVSENASARWKTGLNDFREWIKGAITSHDSMYNEVPPMDGHRLNILRPEHTGVGIGVAFDDQRFYMTEEFTDHYVDLEPVTFNKNNALLKGKSLAGTRIKNVGVFYEDFPKPVTPAEMKGRYSYSYPSDTKFYDAKLKNGYSYSDGSKGSLELDESRQSFELPIDFNRGHGIYTVGVWVGHPQFGTVMATNLSLSVSESGSAPLANWNERIKELPAWLRGQKGIELKDLDEGRKQILTFPYEIVGQNESIPFKLKSFGSSLESDPQAVSFFRVLDISYNPQEGTISFAYETSRGAKGSYKISVPKGAPHHLIEVDGKPASYLLRATN